MITRKRKASIVLEQNQGTEIKTRTTIDYIKQLDGEKFLFFLETKFHWMSSRNEKSIY